MTTIVEEEPYAAVVVNDLLNTVCSYCFHTNEEKPFSRCARCRVVRYCCTDCQKKDWNDVHKEECGFLSRVAPRLPTPMARLLARLAIKREKGDNASVKAFNGRTFEDLMDHIDDIRNDAERLEFFTCLSFVLRDYVSADTLPDAVTLMKYFGRVVVNCFSITNNDSASLGMGIFLGLSALDHSCAPDAFVRFNGRKAILRSPQTGVTFSDKLTIPYTALDQLTSEIQKDLKRQYYFTCKCTVCRDPERDGYARSARCAFCPGVCLVYPDDENLICVSCGAVHPKITVDDAMTANQRVNWFLERERKPEFDDDFKWLQEAIRVYDESFPVLSHLNLPMATLADRIVNMAITLERKDVATKYAGTFAETYKRYLPTGHPLLSYVLLHFAVGRSFDEPPSGTVVGLFEEAREAFLLSHGPRDPDAAYVDKLISNYRNRL